MTVHVIVPDAYDDPLRPSGGNVYDRRLAEALTDLGWTVRVHPVTGPWPDAGPRGRRALAAVLGAVPAGDAAIVDGLVGSAVPDAVLPHTGRARLVLLVHLPLGVADARPDTRARERAALSGCAVVVTSRWAARWLDAHYALPPGAVTVAEPGVDAAEPAAGTASGRRLLCVGAVTPVKGHDVLGEALAAVRDLDWDCTWAGSTAIDPDFAADVLAAARRRGIGDRLRAVGPLSGARLDAAYARADLLVLPSRAETYGMVVTEALARGVPVVASDVGGVRESLGSTDAGVPGVLVTRADPVALAGALREWLSDGGWRRELRRRAATRRTALAPWSATAERVAAALAATGAEP
ncbi:glycosyltransferase family 4 protein [Cellulomonas alba]|uniref:Glycosyltransferase family 4 protein n=1 Tax=Cellulomonas alba TaxID=3053467 RepID=A0ABT7SJA7_9CELL|nr:glycosyltransferase family 4 protein [Cellulomonas alba]MDM7856266.1 glycosyltransferase family 4 protein [Cellulomonas alba]